MEIIRTLSGARRYKASVVAIGVFDGLHRGHRRIISAARAHAQRIGGTSMVLTFYPDPHRQESIYSLEHRLRLIAEMDIDVCVVIRFNAAFARLSAEEFIARILRDRLGAVAVYIGEDFRFGKNASGDYRLLQRFSLVYGYTLARIKTVKVLSRPVSSTSIRRLISEGKLTEARRLLSRPVSVFGKVIRGSSLGKRLGYPTANINPEHEVIPPAGIYAVRVSVGERVLNGACYIGSRPTIARGLRRKKKNVEVYIFGFHRNIYGTCIEIRFIKKIRAEQHFQSLEALRLQIKDDIAHIKKILK